MTNHGGIRFEPLINLLNGSTRKTDKSYSWSAIIANVSELDGRSQVQASLSSPDGEHLAVWLETKNWLGLKTGHAGFLYAIRDQAAVGRIIVGKREVEAWVLENVL